MTRIIAHLDMDAFFAAVEERDNPRFKNKPIVVGSDPMEGRGRGVVSTANYKAREYGIRSALPISRAWALSKAAEKSGKPAVIFIEPNIQKYSSVSQSVFKILRKYSPSIEPASIDEAYFDLSHTGTFEEAEKTCIKVKAEILEKEKLTCSIGVGANKLISKIAADAKKPDGLTVVRENETEKFIENLSIRKIPGIGPKAEEKLNKLNIKSIRDLKKLGKPELENIFGKRGREMYERARGQDNSPVMESREIKSAGEQETFLKDTLDSNYLLARLEAVSQGAFRRLTADGFREFRTIVVTVRFSDFETQTKSHTLTSPARDVKVLFFEATKLFLPFLDKRGNPKHKQIRLLGVRVEKLS